MKKPERAAFLPALARVLGRDPGTGNFLSARDDSAHANQQQTNDVFSEKWKSYDQSSTPSGIDDAKMNVLPPLNRPISTTGPVVAVRPRR